MVRFSATCVHPVLTLASSCQDANPVLRYLCHLLMLKHTHARETSRHLSQMLTAHLVHDGIPRRTPRQAEHLALAGAELHAPARCAAAAAYAPCLWALAATDAVGAAAAAWRHQLQRGGRRQVSRR